MSTATAAETRRDYVRRIVDAAPPLSDQQRAALRELLRPTRNGDATPPTSPARSQP